MKQLIRLFILIWATSSMYADFKIEGGASYFLPQSDTLRDIYGGGGVNYHMTLSHRVSKHVDLWAGFNYFDKDGHSLGAHQRTNIKIIPVNLGIKYLFPVCFEHVNLGFCNIENFQIDFYINGALKYYFLRIHDHSSFVIRHSNQDGFGVVFGVGSYVYFYKNMFLNLLIDYSSKQFVDFHYRRHTQGHSIDISGWDFGGGIGVEF